MPKSTTIKIRVEEKLFAQFCNAAVKDGRKPINVLLDFIRNYVAVVNDRELASSIDALLESGSSFATAQKPK